MLKMVTEAGAEILFHTYFCDVIARGGAGRGDLENKSGRQRPMPKWSSTLRRR